MKWTQRRAAAATMDDIKTGTPWRTAEEAAARAQVGLKLIYREVKAGRLRAARVGGRRDLRLLDQWVDDWLISTAVPAELRKVVL